MSQKSSQERLKSQIEAARRGLAEVPRDEVANDQLTSHLLQFRASFAIDNLIIF